MCIAIGKLKGRALPSRDILETCWFNNPDGAGFAFNHRNMVCTKKGFMTFDAFWDALCEYDKRYNLKDRGVLLHFRIATHGSHDATMTHPFPVQSDEGALKKIEYVSEFAAIHNGIITLTSAEATKSKVLSDTAVFVRDYLYPLSMNRGWFYHDFNIQLIEKLIDSKMMVMNGNGDIIKTSGFHETDGIWYSNTSYKDTWTRKGKYARYDWDRDYLYGDYGYSYGTGTGSYAKKNVASGATSADDLIDGTHGTILMQCEVGDTVEFDTYTEEITSEDGRYYYIDAYGQIFMGIDEAGREGSLYARSFQYVGEGCFYGRSIQVKSFMATSINSHHVYDEQFIGGYSAPEGDEIPDGYEDGDTEMTGLNEDTPPFDTDDTIPVGAETARNTME